MAGKKADAEAISKWIGSLGEIGEPPEFYFVHRAAEVLGCSFIELDEHPRKHSLMAMAFSIQRGKNEGEFMREMNGEYQRQLKDARKQLEKARK